MTITLQTPCYTVHTGSVVTSTLNDHRHHIETTTRPAGVGPKYYTTTDGGTWCLAKWATWGGPEVIDERFDDEAAADAAAEVTYINDILGNPDYPIYLDLTKAEAALKDLAEQE